MDNNKQIKNSANKEKVGADGLTKKERRALKVKEKQTNEVLDNPHKTEPVKDEPKKQNKKPKSEKAVAVKTPVKPAANQKENNNPAENKTDDEKEQRRKEWEKKFSEQKQSEKGSEDGLSKAQLRAKRRELQEAQRLAKTTPAPVVEKKPQLSEPKQENKILTSVKKVESVSKVPLVHHLYNEDLTKTNCEDTFINIKNVHPAFIRLGVQYSHKTILGSNARCLALLSAVKCLVTDLQTPPKQEYCRYLESTLQVCVEFLQHSRLLAVSMMNAIRHFKLQVTQIDKNYSDERKKEELLNVIDTYIKDEIEKAGEAISLKVKDKIVNGDVIITYGCSSLIRRILLDSHKSGKEFEVIVVDGRPLLEGKEMLRRLVDAGIHCSYVLINAISYVMNSATKILMGAHALLANGCVMSRIGTAQIALVARAYNKPVLVCCETYKFSERVLTDSFVYNEIDDADKLVSIENFDVTSPLANWRSNKYLTPLNLLYDVTPPDLVTAVVTELGFLPCTSVPVVLRIKPAELI